MARGDVLKLLPAGENLDAISRETYNALIGNLADARSRQLSGIGDRPARTTSSHLASVVSVRNSSGVLVPRHGVLQLGAPLITPAQNETEFLSRVTFDGDVPDDAQAPFAILLEPLPDGEIGRGVLLGAVPVKLAVNDEDHVAATSVVDEVGYLETAQSGPATVLWVEDEEHGEGTDPVLRDAYVLLSGGASGGSAGYTAYFVDGIISTEDQVIGAGTKTFRREEDVNPPTTSATINASVLAEYPVTPTSGYLIDPGHKWGLSVEFTSDDAAYPEPSGSFLNSRSLVFWEEELGGAIKQGMIYFRMDGDGIMLAPSRTSIGTANNSFEVVVDSNVCYAVLRGNNTGGSCAYAINQTGGSGYSVGGTATTGGLTFVGGLYISGTAGGITPAAHHTTHEAGGSDLIKLDDLGAPDDNTDLDASTGAHGLLRKLDNDPTHFLDGQGNWSPATATLADDDYGDVTVSSSGTVWQINAGVIGATELGNAVSVSTGAFTTVTVSMALTFGELRTDSTASASTLGSVVGKLGIYDGGGSLVGYLPIYDSIT